MVLADDLCRFLSIPGEKIKFKIALHDIRIGPDRKLEFQHAIQCHPALCDFVSIFIDEWPNDTDEFPKPLCRYQEYCDTHTIKEGSSCEVKP